ncbi:MAG TPA: hypothetical protein VH157_07480 [Bryobacteraceae bacterium]|nr:hypothetical protein [Bryobacteraceae bacterium]
MTRTQRYASQDLKGRRMLTPSRLLVYLLSFLAIAAAQAAPVTYTLSGVAFSDSATASGSFQYDAATNTYSNVNITTTVATRAGVTYNTVSTGLAGDSSGVLVITGAAGSQIGLPGLSLLFAPVLPGTAGTATLTGQEADCSDSVCTAPSGTARSISAGSVTATLGAGVPRQWFLAGVKFVDGATATGSFTFDASSGTFSNVNITTQTGSRTGATLTTLSGGITDDSTSALFVTSNASSQTGLPGFSMFFAPALAPGGGSSALTGKEANCNEPPCNTPTGTARLVSAGFVTSVPLLSISKSHTGNFTQGDIGDVYTLVVTNVSGAPFTTGLVTVTEYPPTGLSVTSMSGSGWTCSFPNCTRTDVLLAGQSYPSISVVVNVAANAPGSMTNQATVIGGGSLPGTASDTTTILPPSPVLVISKNHVGSFAQGQVGGQYTISVRNAGLGAVAGLVTMTETPPAGLTVTAMSGTGWTCNTATCTRADALPPGATYPPVTATVNVSGSAPSPLVNKASVTGGGSVSAAAADSTIITSTQPLLLVNRNVLNFGISGSLITSPQTVLVTIPTIANAAWTATSDHQNITVSPGSGIGTGTFQVSTVAGASGVVTVTVPGVSSTTQTIQVNVKNVTPTVPFGNFDTPLNGVTGIVGAIPVTGWSLDNIEVTHVDILREPVSGEAPGSLVFIGTAIFVADARPDVQSLFPASPLQYRAGWGYQLLTNLLPNSSGSGPIGNGTYTLHAVAFNSAGLQLDLGAKTITVDNTHASKPFGTIDTPAQGATISGTTFVNFGWALTPQTGMIPIDGSTLRVVIDGVLAGNPVYNQFRSDIASLFPNYQNSNGAVGFFYINTTALANGVHTIAWSAFDNMGRGDGLGSRYFTVQNTGGGVAAPEDLIDESVTRKGVQVRHGLNRSRPPEPVVKDSDGTYSVTMEEVGLIELQLGAASGNMLVEGEARRLPTGSTLKGGVFYWQPGPGFLGEYTLEFARPDGTTISVRVKIGPKRYVTQ